MLNHFHLSEIHRPSSTHVTEALAIGSGPLPARAPPEKKASGISSQIQAKSATPRPVAPPSVQELSKSSVTGPPVGIPPLSAKSSLPKLSQPIPVSSRVTLQPVGRGVAAAFADQEEVDDDSNDLPVAKTVETSSVRPVSPPSVGSDKERMGRERAGVYNRTSSMPGDKENDNGSFPARDRSGSRSTGATGTLPASKGDRTESKAVPSRDYEIGGRLLNIPSGEKGRMLSGQNVHGPDKDAIPTNKQPSNRGHRARDQFGKAKLEAGRNVA